MKKPAVFLLILIITLCISLPASASGKVYATDIKAFINYLWVPSYNCDGTTVVIVRDLENYGYNVEWNAEKRCVELYRGTDKAATPHAPNYCAPEDVGLKLFDVYPSDIKVLFGGREIPSFNVGGRVAVKLRDIDIMCNISFNSTSKEVSMRVGQKELAGKELDYINKFYSVLYEITRGDYERLKIEEMLTDGSYSAERMSAFKSYIDSLAKIKAEYKTYTEPQSFSESAMELWWALVNSHYASCTLYEMGLNQKNKRDNPSLSVYLEQYSIDSSQQRDNAMSLLAQDIAHKL